MKDGYHVNCAVSSNFLLDKGHVAENLQKECLCYFIISSTSLWRNQFNHISFMICKTLVVSRAFMPGAASQVGDADSSRAPGLFPGLQGSP